MSLYGKRRNEEERKILQRIRLNINRALWTLLALLIITGCNESPEAGMLNDDEKLHKVMKLYAGYRKSFPAVPDLAAAVKARVVVLR